MTWFRNWRLTCQVKKALSRPGAIDRLPDILVNELGYKRYTDVDDPDNQVFFGPNGERVQIKYVG